MTAVAPFVIRGDSPVRAVSPPPHLAFLDGLRGLCAFYVVVCHAKLMCTDGNPPLPRLLRLATQWLSYGQISVSVFIVISGYCLMLPVVDRPGRHRGGVRAYVFRRARRIFPPYYAALAICVTLILTGALRVPGVSFGLRSFILHLLLLHNLDPASAHQIDSPMWSVATEWQIYFFLPFALLPIWRRFGIWKLCAAALAISLVIYLVFGEAIDEAVHPWYLALFAGGMAAAAVDPGSRIRRRAGWLCVVAVALLPTVYSAKAVLGRHLFFIADCLEGVAAVMLILHCRQCLQSGVRSPALRLLESRPAIWLGAISYSLYLCHFPALQLFYRLLETERVSTVPTLALMIAAGSALAVVFSVPFYLLFERPFLAARVRHPDLVAVAV